MLSELALRPAEGKHLAFEQKHPSQPARRSSYYRNVMLSLSKHLAFERKYHSEGAVTRKIF